MNLLDKLCKELGVGIGEEWLGNNGKVYMIENRRILEYYTPEVYSDTDYEGWVVSGYEAYADLLQGKLKPVWKPKKGEKYYTPSLFPNENERFEWYCWDDDNDEFDKWFFNNNMIFKTKEEAIAAANKMLKALKEDN